MGNVQHLTFGSPAFKRTIVTYNIDLCVRNLYNVMSLCKYFAFCKSGLIYNRLQVLFCLDKRQTLTCLPGCEYRPGRNPANSQKEGNSGSERSKGLCQLYTWALSCSRRGCGGMCYRLRRAAGAAYLQLALALDPPQAGVVNDKRC